MFCSRCGTQLADGSKFCPSCGLDLGSVTPLATGRMLGEATEEEIVRDALQHEYEILEELGRGGMAIVFKAREKQLERDVAIKVLPFVLAFDGEFVERFQREARTSAKLEHPNIIPIYRVGRAGRVIYFVMKFLRGSSLSDVIEQRRILPVRDIRRLLMEAAAALGYAHKHGIVHRDVKPDNIMFDESGRAVVTDFGIAKAGTSTRLTGTGMAIGTPHYMSPEQARAQRLDGRSDIYSLGVVAYQCLAGRVPFDGEDAFSIGYKHVSEPVPVPDLPTPEHRELFEVVKRMMAKNPDERFQRAEDVILALQAQSPVSSLAAQATMPLLAAERVVPRNTVTVTQTAARPWTPTTPIPPTMLRRESPKRRGGGVLVGMLLLAVMGGGGGAYYYYYVQGNPMPDWAEPYVPAAFRPPEPGAAAAAAGLPANTDSLALTDAAPATGAATAPPPAGPSVADLPNTGKVSFRGLPARARIVVDGEVKEGDTLVLDAGSHKLEITAPGYENYTETFALRRGGDTTLTASLRRLRPNRPAQLAPADDVCAAPGPSYNQENACYDSPPKAKVAPLVPLDARIQGMPSETVLWVRVSEDGRGLSFQVIQSSNDPVFNRLAGAFALTIPYNPAQKDGRPVEGWTRMRLLPRSP